MEPLSPPLEVGRRERRQPGKLSPTPVLFHIFASMAGLRDACSCLSWNPTSLPDHLRGEGRCTRHCALLGGTALGVDLKAQLSWQPLDIVISTTFPPLLHIPQLPFVIQSSEDLYWSHGRGLLTDFLTQVENLAYQYAVWSSWVSFKTTSFTLWHFYVREWMDYCL